MKCMRAIRRTEWDLYGANVLKSLIVICRYLVSLPGILWKILQLHVKYSCLEGVEAGVYTNNIVMIFHPLAMIGHHLYLLCQRIIVCEDCASIAIASKVLRWKKGCVTYVSHRTRHLL